ncbi:carotenoid isomerooxygenase [Anabrus simplex]|uniref:carotenoid isomerooxygenase n=1 Tax=Anabrus simplex TaxID=316456 RepID=UPI0035A283BF
MPTDEPTLLYTWSPLVPRRKELPLKHSCPQQKALKEDELARRLAAGEDLYPNCDVSVWLRSCSKEVLDPIEGTITGCVPQWLRGSLLRNGPGSLKVGDMTFEHLFDSSALLHRFCISNGNVTYQNRFLQSQTFKRNTAAQRIVVTEFGTKAAPDPCQSIFQRVAAMFTPGESISDNAMISVYPFGDEFYTFTESPIIHRIDPRTLETMNRLNVAKYVSIVNHSSHPHVLKDGTVFNLGLTVTATGPSYAIVKFPTTRSSADSLPEDKASTFEQATIVGKVPARWPLHPSYMHTFGITERFFVIVEQPLCVSVPGMIKTQLANSPMVAAFRWYNDQQTLVHLMDRETGVLLRTFVTETFFYLHIINCYEEDEHVVVDLCCYRDPSMLDCMYVEAMKGIQKNPDYARMFRGRPLRFVFPLTHSREQEKNLVTLKSSDARAFCLPNGQIFAQPELLCSLGCETPRINYDRYMGRPYRYFYAISSDVDLDNPGTLIKVDTFSRTKKTWSENNIFPSEPIFVPHPDGKEEDDGVILSSLVWGQGEENRAGLLILDAKTWTEIARAEFITPSPVPKCLHGWFASSKQQNKN